MSKNAQNQTSLHKQKFRTNYEKTIHPGIVFDPVTRTKQAFKDECDINNIMARYAKTGQLPDLIKANPAYGDFSDVQTYQESMELVAFAQDQFASLSAKTRDRFQNDPAQFLAFATDPKNGEEMVKMGLASRRQPEAPIPPTPIPSKQEPPETK